MAAGIVGATGASERRGRLWATSITIVRDVEATKKFWTVLGGKPIQIDGVEVMKFPGVFIFLTPGTPSSDCYGTVTEGLNRF